MKVRALVGSLAIVACGGSDGPTGPSGTAGGLAESKLAVVAVAIATAGEGHSFFDNFLACPRRGVIDYRNTANGRSATLSGCDTGDGVVLDGTVEVRWTSAGGDRTRITAIDVTPGARATIAGTDAGAVGAIGVRDVSFSSTTPPSSPTVDRFDFGAAHLVVNGETTPLDERATPDRVFHPSLTIDAIPNSGDALAALTDADLKRLAYSAILGVSTFLFDETLETARGDHSHTLDCGTTQVTVDRARNLPRLTNDWSSCDVGSVFISGQFSAEWTEFDAAKGTLSMLLTGPMTLGGGVPHVIADRVEWRVTGLSTFPNTITIAGTISRGATSRTFNFTVLVDD